MPRVTKAMLEQENKLLRERIYEMQTELQYLREKKKDADILVRSPMAAMTVALERVTESVAHVLGDLKKGQMR